MHAALILHIEANVNEWSFTLTHEAASRARIDPNDLLHLRPSKKLIEQLVVLRVHQRLLELVCKVIEELLGIALLVHVTHTEAAAPPFWVHVLTR
jgi:hypothetical protein